MVRSSRTNSSITDRSVELNDDELGAIASMELSPAKGAGATPREGAMEANRTSGRRLGLGGVS